MDPNKEKGSPPTQKVDQTTQSNSEGSERGTSYEEARKCGRCQFCTLGLDGGDAAGAARAPAEAAAGVAVPPPSPLRLATQLGDAESVRLLLERGSDPNERNLDGRTPLHCAAAAGHGEVTQQLLAAGADPNLRDQRGRTPLHCAASSGHVDVAHQLLSAGAIVDAWSLEATPPVPCQGEHGSSLWESPCAHRWMAQQIASKMPPGSADQAARLTMNLLSRWWRRRKLPLRDLRHWMNKK